MPCDAPVITTTFLSLLMLVSCVWCLWTGVGPPVSDCTQSRNAVLQSGLAFLVSSTAIFSAYFADKRMYAPERTRGRFCQPSCRRLVVPRHNGYPLPR
jgi:hypothetical protein